ncbi:hypothetical protein PsorP6_013730 [Peronosclerospora sorghi]|uniref:Uncharacterized protein n=1 Tax=Peronosclerospora sorghi TaxID=230839 RepID=A0ACC0VFH6_9STRA|nr:hypothetical protein PsorP6_013730 [Peronosclerospora sorghi]
MGKRSLFIPVFSPGHWTLVSVIDSHVVYWNSSKGIGLEAMEVLKQIETFLGMERQRLKLVACPYRLAVADCGTAN